jgi:hypothetical protein
VRAPIRIMDLERGAASYAVIERGAASYAVI